MIEELKKVLLSQISEEIYQIDIIEEEINALKQEANKIKFEYSSSKPPQEKDPFLDSPESIDLISDDPFSETKVSDDIFGEPGNEESNPFDRAQEEMNPNEELSRLYDPFDLPPEPKKPKHSATSRIFNKAACKKEDEKYLEEKKQYDLEQQEREIAKEKLKRLIEIENKIKELEKRLIELNFEEIKKRYENIKAARNLRELGLELKDAIELMRKNNIPILIDATEEIVSNESNFDSIDEFILVHKTDYFPTNDEIKTNKEAGATHKQIINLGEESIEIEFHSERDTIHFTLNGEVNSHFYGNWDKKKYAILLPLKYAKNIVNFSTADTYTRGNVDITNGILLCPKGEGEKLKELNPNLFVIEYYGDNVKNAANIFLSILGYKHKSVKTSGWEDEDSGKATDFKIYKARLGLDGIGQHAGSKEEQEEDIRLTINQLVAIIEKMLNSDINFKVDDATNSLFNYENPLLLCNKTYSLKNGEFLYKLIEILKSYNINIPEYVINIYETIMKGERSNIFQTETIYENIQDKETADFVSSQLDPKIDYSHNTSYRDRLVVFNRLLVYEIFNQIKKIKDNKINIDKTTNIFLDM